jgi:hypothetical protein
MTRQAPPARFTGSPHRWTLPGGSTLSRVHQDRFASTSFNSVSSDVLFGGGRFDATDRDSHGFLYAALKDGAALAETLMREIPSDDRGYRFLRKPLWRGRELSRLSTTSNLSLVALRTGEELGAIGQDGWLTSCDADEYPQTREWSRWLRLQASDAHGATWLSKRDPGEIVMVLWEDRCPPDALVPAAGPLPGRTRFDNLDGFDWLRDALARYRVTIRR